MRICHEKSGAPIQLECIISDSINRIDHSPNMEARVCDYPNCYFINARLGDVSFCQVSKPMDTTDGSLDIGYNSFDNATGTYCAYNHT